MNAEGQLLAISEESTRNSPVRKYLMDARVLVDDAYVVRVHCNNDD